MADINIGQITEALNYKMDLDSGNANPAVAKQSDLAALITTVERLQNKVTLLQGEISSMLGRIDYINVISGSLVSTKSRSTINNSSYVIPTNGYFYISSVGYNDGSSHMGSSNTASFYIRVNNTRASSLQSVQDGATTSWGILAPTAGEFIFVSKDDIITLELTTTGTSASGQTLTAPYVFYPEKL